MGLSRKKQNGASTTVETKFLFSDLFAAVFVLVHWMLFFAGIDSGAAARVPTPRRRSPVGKAGRLIMVKAVVYVLTQSL
jgi:hypothetical protein